MFKRIQTLTMVAAMSSNAVKLNTETELEIAVNTVTEPEVALLAQTVSEVALDTQTEHKTPEQRFNRKLDKTRKKIKNV